MAGEPNYTEILPKTVRAVLNIDNDGIIKLCKAADVPLRKNRKGLTYFTEEDVSTLKKISDIQQQAKQQEIKSAKLKNALKKLPAKKSENIPPAVHNNNDETVKFLKQITGAVKNIENGIYEKFSLIVETKLEDKLEEKLEEKLGGIDEVIMDLVRCKAEAEELRKEIAENNKEIYELKNELSRYKKTVGNIYIKGEIRESQFNV